MIVEQRFAPRKNTAWDALVSRRAKGEGSISRRADGRYEGRLSAGFRNGRRVRHIVYGDTRTEVAAKLQALRASGGHSPQTLLVGEYLELWLRDGKSRWEPQTHRTYTSWLKHAVRHIGHRRVSSLTTPDIRAWLRQLEGAKVGASTRKRSLSTLRSALQELVDDSQLDRNPCAGVKPPKVRRKPIAIPEPDHVKRLLDVVQPFWVYVLLLIAFSGTQRQGEIFAMHWDQIDFDSLSIRVDRSLAIGWDGRSQERKLPKNSHSLRTVVFPAGVIEALKALRRKQVSEGYSGPWVFPDSAGGPLRRSNFMRREFREALRSAGLPNLRFHALRHSGNSLLIQEGENPLSVSRRMGHSDTRMAFNDYGHLFDNAGRKAADRMKSGLDSSGISAIVGRRNDDA